MDEALPLDFLIAVIVIFLISTFYIYIIVLILIHNKLNNWASNATKVYKRWKDDTFKSLNDQKREIQDLVNSTSDLSLIPEIESKRTAASSFLKDSDIYINQLAALLASPPKVSTIPDILSWKNFFLQHNLLIKNLIKYHYQLKKIKTINDLAINYIGKARTQYESILVIPQVFIKECEKMIKHLQILKKKIDSESDKGIKTNDWKGIANNLEIELNTIKPQLNLEAIDRTLYLQRYTRTVKGFNKLNTDINEAIKSREFLDDQIKTNENNLNICVSKLNSSNLQDLYQNLTSKIKKLNSFTRLSRGENNFPIAINYSQNASLFIEIVNIALRAHGELTNLNNAHNVALNQSEITEAIAALNKLLYKTQTVSEVKDANEIIRLAGNILYKSHRLIEQYKSDAKKRQKSAIQAKKELETQRDRLLKISTLDNETLIYQCNQLLKSQPVENTSLKLLDNWITETSQLAEKIKEISVNLEKKISDLRVKISSRSYFLISAEEYSQNWPCLIEDKDEIDSSYKKAKSALTEINGCDTVSKLESKINSILIWIDDIHKKGLETKNNFYNLEELKKYLLQSIKKLEGIERNNQDSEIAQNLFDGIKTHINLAQKSNSIQTAFDYLNKAKDFIIHFEAQHLNKSVQTNVGTMNANNSNLIINSQLDNSSSIINK